MCFESILTNAVQSAFHGSLTLAADPARSLKAGLRRSPRIGILRRAQTFGSFCTALGMCMKWERENEGILHNAHSTTQNTICLIYIRFPVACISELLKTLWNNKCNICVLLLWAMCCFPLKGCTCKINVNNCAYVCVCVRVRGREREGERHW